MNKVEFKSISHLIYLSSEKLYHIGKFYIYSEKGSISKIYLIFNLLINVMLLMLLILNTCDGI